MAVAYVSSGAVAITSPTTTGTVSGLSVTGSDRLVTACLQTSFNRTLTSITAAGNAMNDSGLGELNTTNSSYWATYLGESGLSAATSQDIVATWSGGNSTGGLIAASFSGVASSAPESVESQTTNSASSITDSDATVSDDALCVAMGSTRNDQAITPTGDFTERLDFQVTATARMWVGEYVAGAAPDTADLTLSWSSATEAATFIMIFAEASAAPSAASQWMMMGVG